MPHPSNNAADQGVAEKWSVIIPAYNEEDFLEGTVETVRHQSVGEPMLILVDNKSTDGTCQVMEKIAADRPAGLTKVLSDDRPGKINAMQTGIAALETEFVAMFDADTIYPPDYLAKAEAMMADEKVAGAFAFGIYGDDTDFRRWYRTTKNAAVAKLLPAQGHTGGYGHSFRVKHLKAAGGYSPEIWPFMVADHEIVNRVLKQGPIRYARDHVCITSERRTTRKRVDWNLQERLLYNVLPHSRQDWFFYEFLKPRFEARGMFNSNLRDRDWEET